MTYKVEQQYEGGSTLKQAFGKDIVDGDDEPTKKAKIEQQIKRYGRREHTTWEWSNDGQTLVLTHRLPAIRTQHGTNLPTLFTGLAAYYKRLEAGHKNIAQQTFGDGTPIPEHYLKKLADVTDEIRVLHKWHQGDVLVFDNVIAQHGRQPWQGEQLDRIIMASLWDGVIPGCYQGSDPSWGQVVQASAR